MSFEDKTLKCVDCGKDFVHSADDQSRYAERGFSNEPKRCRECRDSRKSQGGGRGGRRGAEAAGGSGGGPPRDSFDVTCAECGAQTTVPFKPTEGRPVYCRDCFRTRRSSEPRH